MIPNKLSKSGCLYPTTGLISLWDSIPSQLRGQCAATYRSCCLRSLRTNACQIARQTLTDHLVGLHFGQSKFLGPALRQCTLPSNTKSEMLTLEWSVGASAFIDCCESCKLGMRAAAAGFTCLLSEELRLSKEYEQSYYGCCVAYRNQENQARLSSNSSSAANIFQERLKALLPIQDQLTVSKPPFGKKGALQIENAHPLNISQVQEIGQKIDLSIKQWMVNSVQLQVDSIEEKEAIRINEDTSKQNNVFVRKSSKDVFANSIFYDFCLSKNCDQKCVSYSDRAECQCFKGYRLQKSQIHCVDIDECAENLHNCKCQNNRFMKTNLVCKRLHN